MEEKTTPLNQHHAGNSVWKRLFTVAEETSGSGSCGALRGCENLRILMLFEYNEALLFLSSKRAVWTRGPVNRSLCGLLLLTGIRTCRRYTGRVWMPGDVFPVVPTQQFQLFFKMLHIGITEPHKSSASLLFFFFPKNHSTAGVYWSQ